MRVGVHTPPFTIYHVQSVRSCWEGRYNPHIYVAVCRSKEIIRFSLRYSLVCIHRIAYSYKENQKLGFSSAVYICNFFIFRRAGVCWPLLCLCHTFCVAHFSIFESCLDWNPESCRRKQARYQLSHPSLYLATHLSGCLYILQCLQFWPLDPGSGKGFFRIPDPKPIFLRAWGQFFE